MRYRLLVLAAFALSVPAHAELIVKSDTGFVTRTTATVVTSPAETWDVLVAPARWWNKAHTWSGDAANLTLDPSAGGCFCEALPAAGSGLGGSVEHMRVIHSSPGKVLRLSGALGPLQSEGLQGTLTITFKPVEAGTRIMFEYVVGGYMRFKTDEIAPAVDGVMREQLGRLAALAGPLVSPVETAKPADSEPGR